MSAKKDISFYELKGYAGSVAQIDEGMKNTGHLVNLMTERARIEKEYSTKLEKWATTMTNKLKKMKEHEHCGKVWSELIAEANCTASIHKAVMDDITANCVSPTKQFKTETWKTSLFGGSAQKSQHNKNFVEAQKGWSSLIGKTKKAKANYDKANKALATQQATVANASTGADPNDPKVIKQQQLLETKKQNLETAKENYQMCISELSQIKSDYVQQMNSVFNEVVDFEKNRLEFSRKMMITYREATKVKIGNDLSYELKDAEEAINVPQKISTIDQVVQAQSVETAIDEFNRVQGPGNAANYQWPAFEDYDAEGVAQQNKFSKANNGASVARNDTEGTIRPIEEASYNGVENSESYDQSYDEQPVEAAEPVSPATYEPPAAEEWSTEPEKSEPVEAASDGVYVTVQFPYEAMDDDELTLEEGESILKIGEADEEGWCQGRKLDGTEGMFPIDYVDQGEVGA